MREAKLKLIPWSLLLLGASVLSACLLARSGAAGAATTGAAQANPNVLLIITDDQRDGEMQFMDEVRQRLTGQGRTYREAYATTPLCCPSRGSIYSGKYAHNHGLDGNEGGNGVDQYALDETWPALLQDAGYRTGLSGKFLNGWPREEHPSIFDFYDWPERPDLRETGVDVDVARARNALRFIRRQERRDSAPWAFTLSLFAPHGPYRPLPKYEGWSPGHFPTNPATRERDISDKAPSVRRNQSSDARVQYRWDGQSQALRAADDLIGNLLGVLDRAKERTRTLVIFISDNGYLMGEHGLTEKTWPYTGSIGVPLILRWPNHIAPDERTDDLVANIDLAPTIYEAAGVTPNYPVDGRSLLGGANRPWLLLEGPRQREDSPYDAWDAYLDPEQHYIDWEDDADWQEYYNLLDDPYETENLLTDGDPSNDAGGAALKSLIEEARTCEGASCP